MFFGKKESKGGLPDLPPSRNSFRLGENAPYGAGEETEEQSLPAFPDSPTHNKFSEAVIKDAVGSSREEKEEEFIAEFPEEPRQGAGNVVEMEEWSPNEEVRKSPFEEEVLVKEPELAKTEDESVKVSLRGHKREADVFVKIDKFYSAKRSLGEIRKNLGDVEELIKRIRETKLREEQELSAWEKDLMQIKTRLKDVTENIFEKVK